MRAPPDPEHPAAIQPGTHRTLPCRLCADSVLPSTAAKTDGLCLTCWHEEAHRKEDVARETAPGCAICDGSMTATSFWFDWGEAKSGKGRYRKYPAWLRHVLKVKNGARFECTRCHAVWYLHTASRRERMMHIPAPSVATFETWCKTHLVCPRDVLSVARSIGATPADCYGNGANLITIPCRVTTTSGEQVELAALLFSDEPPIPAGADEPERTPTFRLINDVAAIAPSRFALSRRVRFHTSRAMELRMGFAPTIVKARDGRRFLLNGQPDFFDHAGVIGSDLTLTGDWQNAMLVTQPHGPLTYFAADAFDGMNAMRITGLDPMAWLISGFRWAMSGKGPT